MNDFKFSKPALILGLILALSILSFSSMYLVHVPAVNMELDSQSVQHVYELLSPRR